MGEYKLDVKQVVDHPWCRIYRELLQRLTQDQNIRTSGGSGLFHYVALCSYVNFRTSYRRLDGISYTVFPGAWICRITELEKHLRLGRRRPVLQALDERGGLHRLYAAGPGQAGQVPHHPLGLSQ